MDTPSKQRLDEILAKSPEMLGEDEVGFLRARRGYLSEADVKKFAEVLEDVKTEEKAEPVKVVSEVKEKVEVEKKPKKIKKKK